MRFPRKRFNRMTLSINAFGIDLPGCTASARSKRSRGSRITRRAFAPGDQVRLITAMLEDLYHS
jgi:hypothetical protein